MSEEERDLTSLAVAAILLVFLVSAFVFRLPQTGASSIALGAGVFLVIAGLIARRIVR